VVSTVATVYALTSYVFHQTLEVPGTAIKIYQNPNPNLRFGYASLEVLMVSLQI